MPYVVLLLLIGLAIVGTHYLAGKSPSDAKSKSPKAEVRQNPAPPADKEPVLGFELPAKSYIGTIGKEKGLKAVLFGRKSDLVKLLGSPSLGLNLGTGSTESTSNIDPLAGMNPSREPAPTSVKPAHVLLMLANAKQFLKLIEETRDTTSDGFSGKGSLTIDSRGGVEISLGSVVGVELDATSLEKLDISYPNGAFRVSVQG